MAERNEQTPRLTRREFIKRGGATVLVAGAATGGAFWLHDETGEAGLRQPSPQRLPNFFAPVDYSASAPRLSVARGRSNERAEVDRMVRAAVDGLGGKGLSPFVGNGDVVLLKPNVGFERAPQFAATTNPDVVASVIRLCKEAGAAEVIVTDNPIEAPESCFARSGIGAACDRAGARMLLPASAHFEPLAIRPPDPDGTPHQPDPAKDEALGTWPVLWTPVRRATKVIGLPVIKDHNLCHASMGLKNWYGLLGGRRNQFHQAIHAIISDLGLMMSPTLTIVDGTRVLMRNGPTGGSLGDVRECHTVAAGVDPIACDAWAYEVLLERDPAALLYLDMAQEKFGHADGEGRTYEKTQRLGNRRWREYQNQGLLREVTV